MTQPAERITNVPITKITNSRSSGWPSADTHRAHSTGQSSSQMPIGRSRRMSREYSRSRSPMAERVPRPVPWSMSVALRIDSLAADSDLAEALEFPDPAAQQGQYVRSWTFQHQCRRFLHRRQQVGVPYQVRDLELHEPRLAGSEQFAG